MILVGGEEPQRRGDGGKRRRKTELVVAAGGGEPSEKEGWGVANKSEGGRGAFFIAQNGVHQRVHMGDEVAAAIGASGAVSCGYCLN